MFKKIFAAGLLATGFTCTAHAGDEAQKADVQKNAMAALHAVAPGARVDSVAPSTVPGLIEVVADGHVVYLTADGKYLIQGDIYDIAAKKSLTSARGAALRKEAIAKIPLDKQLVFAPAHPKHTVTVFTDVDCPYCRQFHQQIAEYNKLGIAVDYVLFPLPFHKGADKKAEAVWCAADRNATYTAAMSGVDPGSKTCTNPVQELYKLGTAMGVQGTPAVFAEDGTELGGYVSPADLAQKLDSLSANKAAN